MIQAHHHRPLKTALCVRAKLGGLPPLVHTRRTCSRSQMNCTLTSCVKSCRQAGMCYHSACATPPLRLPTCRRGRPMTHRLHQAKAAEHPCLFLWRTRPSARSLASMPCTAPPLHPASCLLRRSGMPQPQKHILASSRYPSTLRRETRLHFDGHTYPKASVGTNL